MITDGPYVARLGARVPERPRAKGGWHQGPRIVFSAPPPWELNPAALSTVSEPGSLNHPWSPRSFQLPPHPSVTPSSSSLPPAAAPRLPWGCLLGRGSWGPQTAWPLPGRSRPPPLLAPGGLVSFPIPSLHPLASSSPGENPLQPQDGGTGRGVSRVLCVTESVFALASAPDEEIV